MRRGHGDRGTTLVEVAVSMLLFGVVAAGVTSFLISFTRQAQQTNRTAAQLGDLRVALDSLEVQVYNGDRLTLDSPSPCTSSGSAGGSCLRVSTRVGGQQRCAQWQLVPDTANAGTSLLRTRSYSDAYATDGSLTPWRTVAKDLATSAGPFVLTPTSGGWNVLAVTLAAATVTSSAPPSVTATFVPRNPIYGALASTAVQHCTGVAPA